MNLLLVCHGALKEYSSFDVPKNVEVQYRGVYGTLLGEPEAMAIVQALLDNPVATEKEIG